MFIKLVPFIAKPQFKKRHNIYEDVFLSDVLLKQLSKSKLLRADQIMGVRLTIDVRKLLM